MRQHPVGVRCKECSHTTVLPTYRVSTSYVARGVTAAVVAGFISAVLLTILAGFLGNGIIFLFLMAGVGYVVGEAVSVATNHRRGGAYQYIAAGGALLGTAPVLAPLFIFGGTLQLLGLAGVVVAVWVAVRRLAA